MPLKVSLSINKDNFAEICDLMRISILLMLGLCLSACAARSTSPYVYNPKYSLACNVSKAGNLGISRDSATPGGTFLTSQGGVMLAEVAAGAKLLDAFAFGVALGDGLNKGPRDTVAAWMPKNLAATPEAARALMTDMIKTASIKAAEESGISQNGFYSYKDFPQFNGIGQNTPVLRVDEQQSGGETSFGMLGLLEVKTIGGWSSPHCDPDVVAAPEFVTPQGPAWEFARHESSCFWGASNGKARITAKGKTKYEAGPASPESFAFFLSLSKNMPDWFFLLLMNVDVPNMGNVPVVLNKGQAHFFVSPGKG